ncbi:tripartite tricarboxylate transporter TctB family protein [Celeribacter sp.]|uniref:tripartite tricarboxylate transporter TctB family protein n=1 Tax=Celeribacter sp. TaxID=1890673 RepID=UPI003A93337F
MAGGLLDPVVLIILALLSAAAFHLAGDFSDNTPSGGHVFPRLASGTVFAMAILALVQSVRSRPVDPATTDATKPLVLAAISLAFLMLMPTVGYPLVAPIWVGATMWTFGLRNLKTLFIIAIGVSAIAWILLSRLAFAPPPAGLFDRFL